MYLIYYMWLNDVKSSERENSTLYGKLQFDYKLHLFECLEKS